MIHVNASHVEGVFGNEGSLGKVKVCWFCGSVLVCSFVCTHTYTHIHTRTSTHIHAHTHIQSMNIALPLHVHTHTYTHTHTRTHTCTHLCTHTPCACIRTTHTYTHTRTTYTHTHTHTHTHVHSHTRMQANWLVCLAWWQAISATDTFSKIAAVWLPVFTFTVSRIFLFFFRFSLVYSLPFFVSAFVPFVLSF